MHWGWPQKRLRTKVPGLRNLRRLSKRFQLDGTLPSICSSVFWSFDKQLPRFYAAKPSARGKMLYSTCQQRSGALWRALWSFYTPLKWLQQAWAPSWMCLCPVFFPYSRKKSSHSQAWVQPGTRPRQHTHEKKMCTYMQTRYSFVLNHLPCQCLWIEHQ